MRSLSIALISCILLVVTGAFASQVNVHYQEGAARGFMILRTTGGTAIADGQNMQTARGYRVQSRLIFHFKDGSLYDDTTVYTERGVFRLVSDHSIEKGPSFKTQMETYIDASAGQVSVRYLDGHKTKFLRQKMKLPPDISNGILNIIVKNLYPSPATTVSYLAFTPKPKLVKLVFTRAGEQTCFTDGAPHEAIHYVMKVDIGGVTGAVASVFGKVPADTQFWLLDGAPPGFVGSEGPLYGNGPVWRIDLVSPVRSGAAAHAAEGDPHR